MTVTDDRVTWTKSRKCVFMREAHQLIPTGFFQRLFINKTNIMKFLSSGGFWVEKNIMQVLFVVHRAHSNLNQTSNLRIYMFFQEIDTSISQLFNWYNFYVFKFLSHWNMIINWVSNKKLENFYIKEISFYLFICIPKMKEYTLVGKLSFKFSQPYFPFFNLELILFKTFDYNKNYFFNKHFSAQ